MTYLKLQNGENAHQGTGQLFETKRVNQGQESQHVFRAARRPGLLEWLVACVVQRSVLLPPHARAELDRRHFEGSPLPRGRAFRRRLDKG